MEFFPKDSFQSQHNEADDRETEQGNHSWQHDIPRTDRERYHESDEEHEEMEVLPEHVEKSRKDKHFQKIMDILLHEEKRNISSNLHKKGLGCLITLISKI